MGIVAIIPVAQVAAANAALTALGFGPVSFSVPAITETGITHGCLHDWGTIPALVAAIKALPGVVFNEGTGDPSARLRALLAAASTQWAYDAPPLPSAGLTVAKRIYRYDAGGATTLWLSIVAFDRTTFSGPPDTLAPSIIRQWRPPGEVLPWKQPIDQFDAYHAVNPITGRPDQVTHGGKTWDCLIANNVNTPGVANWREVTTNGYPAWLQPTGAGDAYPVGFRVRHLGQDWQNNNPANVFEPGVAGWSVIP